MSELRTYRHSGTGKVGVFPVTIAATFPELVEVPESSKPLAYTPIPAEAVEALRDSSTAGVDGDQAPQDSAPDPTPAPSPTKRKAARRG